MTWTVRIPNWEKFQHYKDRNPTWIKLYRELLNRRAWRELSGPAAKLLVDIWMLAAESKDGKIALSMPDMAWRLRRKVGTMCADLQTLASLELVELASGAVPECPAPASTEERRGEGEKEQRQRTTKSAADAAGRERA